MPFITRYTRPNIRGGKNLGQLKKDLSTSNPWTSKYSIRPTQGRTNIQYVQHMDEKMHTSLNLSKRLVQTMDEETHNISTPKTIQHMDEAKVVMKDYKFKDVMKNHYSIMFFRRQVKTDECFLIKITPMNEHELIF